MAPLKLVRTGDDLCPWGLDGEGTPEGDRWRGLFGTTVIPLPIADLSLDEALRFALGTPAGREHGVEIRTPRGWDKVEG